MSPSLKQLLEQENSQVKQLIDKSKTVSETVKISK
jgi:hypothetical protein